MIWVISGILFLGCLAVVAVLIKKIRTKDEGNKLQKILAPYIDAEYFQKLDDLEAEEKAAGITKADNKKALEGFGKVIERLVLFQGMREKTQLKLSQAGMKWKASEYLAMTLGISIFCFFMGMGFALVFGVNPILLGVPGLFVGWFLPMMVLGFKKSGRQKAFQRQLVDTLGLISNSLKAGYSFLQAVELVSREAPQPTQDEFQRLLREHSLGLPLDEAMEAMGKRLESDDFDLTVTVVLIQRQIGGNLAEILENIQNTIRERIKLIGTISALTAQGKMGGMVITALPIGLYLIMLLLNHDVMSMLYKQPVGWILIVIGLMMQGMGAFVIYNMLQVEM